MSCHRGRSSSAATALHIPPTVQGVLAARIDRLAPEEKALLQQLAVIGREFPLGLIRQVIPQPEDDLYRLLSSLQRKEFLYEQPAFPEVEYIFKHALTQEVAYGRCCRSGASLTRAHGPGDWKPVQHQRSMSTTVNSRIITAQWQHRKGDRISTAGGTTSGPTLGQCGSDHSSDDRLRSPQHVARHPRARPTRTHAARHPGRAVTGHQGFSSPEVGAAYTRARELCQQVGETRQFFPVLFGLRTFHHVRGEFLAARKLGEQLLGLAQREQDPALLREAYWALGSTLFHLGEFGTAQAHLEQGMTLYDAQRHHSHVFLYGIEPGVIGLSYAAWVLWHLGYPDQTLQKNEAAHTLAQELSYPFNLATARAFAAMLTSSAGKEP